MKPSGSASCPNVLSTFHLWLVATSTIPCTLSWYHFWYAPPVAPGAVLNIYHWPNSAPLSPATEYSNFWYAPFAKPCSSETIQLHTATFGIHHLLNSTEPLQLGTATLGMLRMPNCACLSFSSWAHPSISLWNLLITSTGGPITYFWVSYLGQDPQGGPW